MHTPSPRKKLPVNPSLEHLQKQAKRRAKENPPLQLTAAQHQLAREYGCSHWEELTAMVSAMATRHDVADDKRFEELPAAARRRDFETVRRLLQDGTFTPHTLDQALAHSLWYGDESSWPEREKLALLLLDHGADPGGQYGSGGYGPIVFGAAECVQPEALQWLIDHGADVTAPPIPTKYGPQSVLSHLLGTYNRGRNARKHQCLEILLRHGAWAPPELTPPVLAIHRGSETNLADCLTADPAWTRRRIADLPYGNVSLRGATLLHCAVEFGEMGCMRVLLEKGADPNARAEVVDGVGGQTPIYHAIATVSDAGLPVLKFLIEQLRAQLDLKVKAQIRRFDQVTPSAMTPLEFAEYTLRTDEAHLHGRADEELALLRDLDGA